MNLQPIEATDVKHAAAGPPDAARRLREHRRAAMAESPDDESDVGNPCQLGRIEFPPILTKKPPAGMLADPIVLCHRCGKTRVLPAVPGSERGLCYDCHDGEETCLERLD